MKVVLTQGMKGLGEAGDIKEVKDGYAKNFLLPKKLAVLATAASLKQVEMIKKAEIHKQKKEDLKNEELKKILLNTVAKITAKSQDGKLFGAVSPSDIADALKKEGVEVDKKNLEIEQPIKSTGDFEVKLKLKGGDRASVFVHVD